LTFHFLDVLAPDVGDMRDIGRGSGDAMTTSDFRHETRRSNPPVAAHGSGDEVSAAPV